MIVTVNENKVQLYGTIYPGDGQFVVYELQQVLAKYENVEVHLHTAGGSVFDGNLIYNVLKQSEATIRMVIDGLACSMGSILMLAGSKIAMASNAFVMVHAPSGSVDGTATDMQNASKLLLKIEKVMLSQYAKRTGKTPAELNDWMEGDNWFSAQDALDAGLIDEIIEPIMDEELQAEDLMKLDIVALQKKFDVKAKVPNPTPKTKEQNQQNTMKKEVISALSLTSVTAESSDTAVIQAIQNRLTDATNKATQKEEEIKALKTQLENFQKATITSVVTKAIQEGRISETAREKYENIGMTAGVETLNSILSDIPTKPASIANQIHPNSNRALDTTETWDTLKVKPGALEQLKASDFDTFNALFKAKFGHDFNN